MFRRVSMVVLVVFLLNSSLTRSEAQSLVVDRRFTPVDRSVKINPELALLIFDFSSKERAYAVRTDNDSTVQTVLEQFGPFPKEAGDYYRVFAVRPGNNGEADAVTPVSWKGKGVDRNPATDVPLKPGDRIVVLCRPPFASPRFAKTLSPFERFVGIFKWR